MARFTYRCRELVEAVTAYLDGALQPGARAAFEAHVRHCKACQAFVEQLRRTIEALRQLPAGPCPGDIDGLRTLFRDWRDASAGATPLDG